MSCEAPVRPETADKVMTLARQAETEDREEEPRRILRGKQAPRGEASGEQGEGDVSETVDGKETELDEGVERGCRKEEDPGEEGREPKIKRAPRPLLIRSVRSMRRHTSHTEVGALFASRPRAEGMRTGQAEALEKRDGCRLSTWTTSS